MIVLKYLAALLIFLVFNLEAAGNVTAVAASVKSVPKEDKPIEISFGGDILLDGKVAANIEKYGVNYPFEKVRDILSGSDISFANLETPISTRGQKANKTYTFRSAPQTLQSIINSGIDGVSIANNHTLDYGVNALADTLAYLDEYKLGRTGAGRDIDEAFTAYSKKVNGKKVAIVGISRVLSGPSWYAGDGKAGIASGYDFDTMMRYVKNAVKYSDLTIIYIHWNNEYQDYPEDYARTYAKAFIDAGVDAVIGSHSHCLQGIETYKGKPIFYSLGNFVFTPTQRSNKAYDSMIATLTFDGDKVSSKITPVRLENTRPILRNAAYNETTYSKLNKISFNVRINEDGSVTAK
ncbi:CapA family protein [Paenibacillus glycanilyticus]|uniref:CapA family protein n=1 Tax=Paenibacillus glycanilyticus TaxID=126569 RepID=UPI0020401A93|nr:CapA family protein [Paenibacillus glycanilyticus]MCM3630830.1 CapA family protein [Paenibacillus glycanilyticus]